MNDIWFEFRSFSATLPCVNATAKTGVDYEFVLCLSANRAPQKYTTHSKMLSRKDDPVPKSQNVTVA
jgi:hypothetical protein